MTPTPGFHAYPGLFGRFGIQKHEIELLDGFESGLQNGALLGRQAALAAGLFYVLKFSNINYQKIVSRVIPMKSYRDNAEDVLDILFAAKLVFEEARHILNFLGLLRNVFHVTSQIFYRGLKNKDVS